TTLTWVWAYSAFEQAEYAQTQVSVVLQKDRADVPVPVGLAVPRRFTLESRDTEPPADGPAAPLAEVAQDAHHQAARLTRQRVDAEALQCAQTGDVLHGGCSGVIGWVLAGGGTIGCHDSAAPRGGGSRRKSSSQRARTASRTDRTSAWVVS